MKNKKRQYIITGWVWGNLWGGGQGGYPSERLIGKNKSYLIKKANKMLKDGSLDSGMGYESLEGCLLNIETITTYYDKNGNDYNHSDYETMTIGNLSDEAEEILLNAY